RLRELCRLSVARFEKGWRQRSRTDYGGRERPLSRGLAARPIYSRCERTRSSKDPREAAFVHDRFATDGPRGHGNGYRRALSWRLTSTAVASIFRAPKL